MPKAPKISIERVREVLEYEPETGSLKWKKNTSKTNRTGKEAGTVGANGYRYIRIDNGEYLAQRLIWMIIYGVFCEYPISFKDENKLNLKLENLIEKKPLFKSKFDHSTPEGKAAYSKAWRDENPEKVKAKSLKQDFGITIEQYNEMLISQKGCCAICNLPETATRSGKIKALAVDHCHGTGNIRDLLCNKCNIGLGSFGDNIETMKNAISYIEKHNQPKKDSNVITLKGAK